MPGANTQTTVNQLRQDLAGNGRLAARQTAPVIQPMAKILLLEATSGRRAETYSIVAMSWKGRSQTS